MRDWCLSEDCLVLGEQVRKQKLTLTYLLRKYAFCNVMGKTYTTKLVVYIFLEYGQVPPRDEKRLWDPCFAYTALLGRESSLGSSIVFILFCDSILYSHIPLLTPAGKQLVWLRYNVLCVALAPLPREVYKLRVSGFRILSTAILFTYQATLHDLKIPIF